MAKEQNSGMFQLANNNSDEQSYSAVVAALWLARPINATNNVTQTDALHKPVKCKYNSMPVEFIIILMQNTVDPI